MTIDKTEMEPLPQEFDILPRVLLKQGVNLIITGGIGQFAGEKNEILSITGLRSL